MGTVGWDEAKKRAAEVGTGKYVRMKGDGDKVKGVFMGAPSFRETHFNQATKQTEPYTPEHKAKGIDPTVKFEINFFLVSSFLGGVAASGINEMKILGMSKPTFDIMNECREKYRGLEGKLFEVKRRGAAGDTNTSYTILPDHPIELAPELVAVLATLKLHDLEKSTGEDDESTDMNSHKKANGTATPHAPAAAASPPPPPAQPAGPRLIDGDTFKTLMPRVKAQTAERIKEFWDTFGIKKLTDLRLDQLPAALNLIDGWEKAASAAPTEIDPFAPPA